VRVLERYGADVHGTAAVNPPETTSADAMFAAAKGNGVIERGDRLCLPREAHDAFGVRCERLWKDLERDSAIELGIARAIHLTHAACPEGADDVVGADTGAGLQSHLAAFAFTTPPPDARRAPD
jgi:hypothetical protein